MGRTVTTTLESQTRFIASSQLAKKLLQVERVRGRQYLINFVRINGVLTPRDGYSILQSSPHGYHVRDLSDEELGRLREIFGDIDEYGFVTERGKRICRIPCGFEALTGFGFKGRIIKKDYQE